MLNAFKGVPKRPQMDYYRFQDNKRGKNAALVATTVERPIVYHVFGHHEEGASLVLREADIIDHLVQIIKGEPPIPDQVRSVLKEFGDSFLFLGFGFHNWYSRVLLKVLKCTVTTTSRLPSKILSFFDLPEHPQTTKFFSGDRLIDFRHLHWEQFARELRQTYEEGCARRRDPSAGGARTRLSRFSATRARTAPRSISSAESLKRTASRFGRTSRICAPGTAGTTCCSRSSRTRSTM